MAKLKKTIQTYLEGNFTSQTAQESYSGIQKIFEQHLEGIEEGLSAHIYGDFDKGIDIKKSERVLKEADKFLKAFNGAVNNLEKSKFVTRVPGKRAALRVLKHSIGFKTTDETTLQSFAQGVSVDFDIIKRNIKANIGIANIVDFTRAVSEVVEQSSEMGKQTPNMLKIMADNMRDAMAKINQYIEEGIKKSVSLN